MPSHVEPMEVDESPQISFTNEAEDGVMTPSPCHVNTGVYSGHPGLQAFLTLGVPINAPLSAIKSAYRKLAREYHPDRLKGAISSQEQGAINQKFSEISHAYDLLTHSYSEYDGKGAGENYPVFFCTSGSLDSHKPGRREGDPYELYRENANTDLPHQAPEHCIIPGDSSSLFRAWSEPCVPLALPYEAQPPPLPPQADATDMDDERIDEVPHMKRVMDDDDDDDVDIDMPRQKRRRMADSLFGTNGENAIPVSMNYGGFGVKRDADQAGGMDFGNPAAKKRRIA